MAVNKNFIDMSHGPLFSKIIRYAMPLMFTYLLQLAFHAADMVVIGRYGSPESLAAIGATGAITALIVNVITGLSTGTNVLAAQYFGAKDSKNMTRLVHTAISISIVGGVAASLFGFASVKWLVNVTDIPEASQSKSILYLIICFIGVPFQIIYNFGSAILRAVGNTKSPFYYLTFAGAVNVLLNLFLVISCKMDVAGVAIATVMSQAISACLVVRRLKHNHGATRLITRNLRIDITQLKKILRLGVPAGAQSGCFSISNMVVQSGINSFG
jgi:Na+-driven multidrug efflux pump